MTNTLHDILSHIRACESISIYNEDYHCIFRCNGIIDDEIFDYSEVADTMGISDYLNEEISFIRTEVVGGHIYLRIEL